MLPWQPLFWFLMGYNFGCTIASDTLFDFRGGFWYQAIRWRRSRFRGSKGHCHGNNFGFSIYGVHIGATWRIWLNRPFASVMRPYVKLRWPLVNRAISATCWNSLAYCFSVKHGLDSMGNCAAGAIKVKLSETLFHRSVWRDTQHHSLGSFQKNRITMVNSKLSHSLLVYTYVE